MRFMVAVVFFIFSSSFFHCIMLMFTTLTLPYTQNKQFPGGYDHNSPSLLSLAWGFQDGFDVGLGTIETPLAMMPLGAADADEDADEATVLTGLLPTIPDATLGETVVVLANELTDEFEFELGGGGGLFEDEFEELLLLLLPLLPLLRTRLESGSTWMSMKVTTGPAIIALLCRSTAPPFSGWSSAVIKIATTPSSPCGTTHWLSGREREKGMPPASIWQWKFCEMVKTRLCEKSIASERWKIKGLRWCCC